MNKEKHREMRQEFGGDGGMESKTIGHLRHSSCCNGTKLEKARTSIE